MKSLEKTEKEDATAKTCVYVFVYQTVGEHVSGAVIYGFSHLS